MGRRSQRMAAGEATSVGEVIVRRNHTVHIARVCAEAKGITGLPPGAGISPAGQPGSRGLS